MGLSMIDLVGTSVTTTMILKTRTFTGMEPTSAELRVLKLTMTATLRVSAGDALWLFAGFVICLTVTYLLRGRHRANRKRLLRAQRAEHAGETLLLQAGYRIIGRQVRKRLLVEVAGKPIDVGVRADLLVKRHSRRFVAEVKSGRLAPDIRLGSTRRQLLEYLLVFDVDGVLLVDPERSRINEVRFPMVSRQPKAYPLLWAMAATLAAVAALTIFLQY